MTNRSVFSNENSSSDSQVTFYEGAVERILSDPKKLRRFRRIYDYREVLEHVDYSLGMKYADIVAQNIYPEGKLKEIICANDSLGNPRKFYFPTIGFASPTTIRYLAVASDIKRQFGKDHFGLVAEIGGGYGGQLSVLDKLGFFAKYHVYDLPQVQDLIRKYLSFINIKNVGYPNLAETSGNSYDLVISNYAFSELPRQVQLSYVENVLLKSKNGYMLMNSGSKNETGRSDGKLSLAELKEFIPNLEVAEEFPLSSPDNYLLTWKS